MDTNPYSNILNAVKGAGEANNGLTTAQQMDNYNTFSKLMKDGVYLPDMVKRISDLEEKVKGMEDSPKSRVNEELFAVMEASVKGEDEVKAARQKLSSIKTEILSEICMKDGRYKEAYDGYRTAVNAAYIRKKEQAEGRRPDA